MALGPARPPGADAIALRRSVGDGIARAFFVLFCRWFWRRRPRRGRLRAPVCRRCCRPERLG
eukprot:1427144-Lingulodinium_polyedra.AAC.1